MFVTLRHKASRSGPAKHINLSTYKDDRRFLRELYYILEDMVIVAKVTEKIKKM